jgi:hypothetical protein
MEVSLELKRSNLVLPTSGYELDREEMSYVEGGGFTLYNWMVSIPIDSALLMCGATALFAGYKVLGKAFGKSLMQTLCKNMAPVIKTVVSTVAGIAFNVAVGQLGNLLFSYAWNFFSAGNLAAFVLDICIDGQINGIIYSW